MATLLSEKSGVHPQMAEAVVQEADEVIGFVVFAFCDFRFQLVHWWHRDDQRWNCSMQRWNRLQQCWRECSISEESVSFSIRRQLFFRFDALIA